MEKALLIEDEQVARERLKKIIDKEGFETLTAGNGQEGLAIFKKENPGLVITDLKLPDIDGMEVIRTLKDLCPQTDIILITGHGDYDTAIQTLREGVLDYIKKPIDLDQLLTALGRHRERRIKREHLFVPQSILVLDDEEVARSKLARVLGKEGYQVFEGADGEEGIRVFMEKKIDLVLADIKMPKKSGLEVLHEIKKLTDDAEVIMITGYGDENTAVEAMREGAINYIRKPIDIDQMLAAIEKAMENLNLKRSLLYRTRDLELAREILARVTKEKEIIVDVRNGLREPARGFARELIDALPFPLFAVDREQSMVFSNRYFARLFEGKPQDIKKGWINELARIGLKREISGKLQACIVELFEHEKNKIETVALDENSIVILTKISAVTEAGKLELVLVILRGQNNAGSSEAGG